MIARHASLTVDALPPLPLSGWQPTKETLHRYLQIVGKVRLEHTPYANHWWHTPLHVTPRGLRAPHMVGGDRTFEIAVDLIAHEVEVATSRGGRARLPLADGLTVAGFYRGLLAALEDVGVSVGLANPRPWDLGDGPDFAADTEHAAYDADAVDRYRRILVWVDYVFRSYGGRFAGKTSPVHLFWHGFDLAVTRFSGRGVDLPPDANMLTREGYSHEVISFGFWPGDSNVPDAAFYAYAAPAPSGLAEHSLSPPAAAWGAGGMALLMYDEVRAAAQPEAALLEFMESVYQAAATAGAWDIDGLGIRPATWRVAERVPAG